MTLTSFHFVVPNIRSSLITEMVCFIVVFVEGVVTGQSKEERSTTCKRVSDMMKETGFPWCIATLEEVHHDSTNL